MRRYSNTATLKKLFKISTGKHAPKADSESWAGSDQLSSLRKKTRSAEGNSEPANNYQTPMPVKGNETIIEGEILRPLLKKAENLINGHLSLLGIF